MTPAELEAVRGRITGGPGGGQQTGPSSMWRQATADRAALLEEVDRLRKVLQAIAAKGDECYRTCKGGPYEGKQCTCAEYLGESATEALEPTP